MSDSLPEVLNVRVGHRVHPGLLLELSLRLGREIGVVFGRSGAGKTTLLRLIAGLTTPDAGKIRLENSTVFDSSRRVNQPLRFRRIGMIFQDDCLFPAFERRRQYPVWPQGLAAPTGGRPARSCGRALRRGDICSSVVQKRSPAASGSGLGWLAHWHRAPGSYFAMSRSPPLTWRTATHSSNAFAPFSARRKSRCSTSRTVRPRPSPWARDCSCLEEGRIVAEGPPLDVLSAAHGTSHRSIAWESVRNVFSARVVSHSPDQIDSRLELDDGPELIVPFLDKAVGTRITVEVRADDIILAREPLSSLSARNQIPGVVERIVPHGTDAEVVIRTGGLTWIVSVVAAAVDQLDLRPGAHLHLIVKARSCHIVS